MMAGRCRPTTMAVAPRPMPMLVVAAVLDAAMATVSSTPIDRVRDCWGGSVPMGLFAGVTVGSALTEGP
ncbi:hypothetical protein GCM10009612_35080 [Streptomyces beijiangensis]